MKRNCLVLFISFMLLLTAGAFAMTGDVTVKINGAVPTDPGQGSWVKPGQTMDLQFFLTNSAKIKGMSLGFQCTNSGGLPFSFQTGWGNIPYEEDGDGNQIFTNCVLKEWGVANNFLNSFGAGGLALTASMLPDTIFYGGADASSGQTKNIVIHTSSTLAYSMKLVVPAGQPAGTFCVKPIYVPPAGAWKMDGGSNPGGGAVNPDFNGVPTVSSADPGIAGVCFVRDLPPCQNPVFTATPGAAVSQNHCSAFTFDFNATEGGNVPVADPVTFTTSAGTINAATGELSVPASAQCGTTNVTVTAHNACGGVLDFPFTINWGNNTPIVNCPSAEQSQTVGVPLNVAVAASDPDPCDAVTVTYTCPDAGVVLVPYAGGVTVTVPDAVAHVITATAVDPCGASASCTFTFKGSLSAPFEIKIPKVDNTLATPVYQGHYVYIDIMEQAQLGSLKMLGFDFLISYDASALTFIQATDAVLQAGGWEYFTYRYGANGNCNGPCPSGLLRLVAIADQNDGPHHPSVFNFVGQSLVNLKFYLTADRTYECQFTPIKFAWMDCGDNGIAASPTNNDTLVSLHINDAVNGVFDYDMSQPTGYRNVTGEECADGYAVQHTGWCPAWGCLNAHYPNKTLPIADVKFITGGIDIPCADEVDARGDLNLNGIANEIADAVLYTNYFLKGITAFPSLGREGAIEASDVNADGRTLTVGDLVYLLRIIVGDALPMPKLAPFAGSANVNFVNGTVSTESGNEIGAVYATFAINGAYTVASNTNMQVENAEVNGELKVLVYSGLSNLSNRISAGSNSLFTVNGDVELKSVEVADYNGNMLNTRVNKTSMPKAFALSQNVPNPFNPTTKIGFALPNQSEWTLSIYNVAGQLVKNFSGSGVGNVSVEWDASTVPSGVYFYKLNAGSFSDTKKMVLMK